MRESTGVTVTDLHIETSGAGAPRRRGRSTAERSRLPVQRPFKQPRMPYQPTNVVSDDELESIHLASLQILEEIGMDFLDAEARELLIKAGASVDPGTERVHFDRAMVEEYRQKAVERVRGAYDWEAITTTYEELFRSM